MGVGQAEHRGRERSPHAEATLGAWRTSPAVGRAARVAAGARVGVRRVRAEGGRAHRHRRHGAPRPSASSRRASGSPRRSDTPPGQSAPRTDEARFVIAPAGEAPGIRSACGAPPRGRRPRPGGRRRRARGPGRNRARAPGAPLPDGLAGRRGPPIPTRSRCAWRPSSRASCSARSSTCASRSSSASRPPARSSKRSSTLTPSLDEVLEAACARACWPRRPRNRCSSRSGRRAAR